MAAGVRERGAGIIRGRAPAAICGIGAVTAYGWGRDRLWEGLAGGESAVVGSSGWQDALGHDVAYLGKIADVPGADPRSRFARAMESAVDEAVADARARGWRPGPVVGLIHSDRDDLLEAAHRDSFCDDPAGKPVLSLRIGHAHEGSRVARRQHARSNPTLHRR